jgi:hypothetical protein
VTSENKRRRKQYAEDVDYRKAVLERNRAFRVAHRDEINARARQAYADDDRRRAKRRIEHSRTYRREERLKQVYGLSVEDYDAMLERQGGVCAICKRKPERPLFVDHCHATGKVRGLLCHGCNSALGFMCDDPRVTAAATEYLLRAARDNDEHSSPGDLVHTRLGTRARKPVARAGRLASPSCLAAHRSQACAGCVKAHRSQACAGCVNRGTI